MYILIYSDLLSSCTYLKYQLDKYIYLTRDRDKLITVIMIVNI